MKKLMLFILLFSIGCGSLLHGTRQEVPITSNPDEADVTINSEFKGKTPLSIELKRKTKKYVIYIEKEGYQSFTTFLIRKTYTATSVVNFVIDFGLISHLIVDKGTGGAYYLTPEFIHVDLIKEK